MGFVWIVVDVMNIFQQIKNKQTATKSQHPADDIHGKRCPEKQPFPFVHFQLQFSNNWFILPNPAKNIYPQLRAPWTNDYASDYRLFLSNACKGRMIPCPSRPPPTPSDPPPPLSTLWAEPLPKILLHRYNSGIQPIFVYTFMTYLFCCW